MKKRAGINFKQLGALLLLMVPIIIFWHTPFLYPLRMLVVFFHELSHGVASMATGGRMLAIQLMKEEGGMCTTQGGNSFLILTAGYLGSMVFGGIILVAAARTHHDKTISKVIGAVIIIVGVFYVRPLISFGVLFCLMAGLFLVIAGQFLGEKVNDFLLKLIGMTSCLYAVTDIVSDGIFRNIPASDSSALGRMTFLPGWLWSGIWLIVSILGTLYFLKLASGKSADTGDENSKPPAA
jgi:hypothetical protein